MERKYFMNDLKLDHVEGYLSMYAFLDLLWERKDESWDELAEMLGAMSLVGDGLPADRGYVQDWDEALEAVAGYRRGVFAPMGIYKAMLFFLNTYDSRGSNDEFKRLIVRLEEDLKANSSPSILQIWQDWMMCVERAKAKQVDAWLRLTK